MTALAISVRACSVALLLILVAGSAPQSMQGGQASTGGAIVPFKISVPDAVLKDLNDRLARARFPNEIEGPSWVDGANLGYVKELVTYWKDKYDWRAQERTLNQFDQFKTSIDGLDIHFIHQRSKHPNALPLLLLNGWPSSIVEFAKVIGPLTDPPAHGGRADDAFHVVIPSMPGYGFSDKPRAGGFNPERMAALWAALMTRLGYTRYATHGTDWGIAVATRLALADAARSAGLHLTSCFGGGAPRPAGATPAPPPQTQTASDTSGYIEIQSTKPQTLGYGLSDSPVGLAAWIVEKFHGWSDHDGDLEKVYTKDELLTNVTIYWVTNSGMSSARLYYETRHAADGRLLASFIEGFLPRLPEGRVAVPTACGNFVARYDRRGNRANNTSRSSADLRYNVARWTDMPRGAHFPALEAPQLWLDDVREFYRERR